MEEKWYHPALCLQTLLLLSGKSSIRSSIRRGAGTNSFLSWIQKHSLRQEADRYGKVTLHQRFCLGRGKWTTSQTVWLEGVRDGTQCWGRGIGGHGVGLWGYLCDLGINTAGQTVRLLFVLTGAKCRGCSVHRNTQLRAGQNLCCVHGFCSGWNKRCTCCVQVADGWHKLFQNPLVLCGWREVREAKMVIMVSEQIAVYQNSALFPSLVLEGRG